MTRLDKNEDLAIEMWDLTQLQVNFLHTWLGEFWDDPMVCHVIGQKFLDLIGAWMSRIDLIVEDT